VPLVAAPRWTQLPVRAYREAFAGIPRAVWWLAAATVVNRAGTMVLPFLPLYLTGPRQLTPAFAGQALAAYGIGAMLGAATGGWLCDRVPALRVMTVSLAASGVCFFLLEHAHSRVAIVVTLLALSTLGEMFRPANNVAIAAASAHGRTAQGIALYRLAHNLGLSVGPVVGGVLAQFSFAWLFRVDGATSLAAAAVLLLAHLRSTAAAGAAASAGALAPAPVAPRWSRARFAFVLALAFVTSCAALQVWGSYVLTLNQDFHFSTVEVGLLLAVNTVLIVVGEMLLVRALRGRNLLVLAGTGALLICSGLGLLPLGTRFGYVAATVIVWTAGEMLFAPHLAAAVAERAPGPRGRVLGLYGLAATAAWVVAPLAGLSLYQRFGARHLWLGVGLLGPPLAIAYFLAARERPATAPQPTGAILR
jgi:predicted MFS family arabinose efflux permease